MPIEMRCAGCGQTLRVADEHAGKKARCPACGTIAQVPPAQEAAPLVPVSDSPFAADSATPPGVGLYVDRPEADFNPYTPPMTPKYEPLQRAPPHRGGLIVTFGVIGLVCAIPFGLCCGPFGLLAIPFGVAAWVMGSADLQKIRAGQMDPSGSGLTRAGMILGIAATVVGALVICLMIAFIALRMM
jgi:phage FluMu protein Com